MKIINKDLRHGDVFLEAEDLDDLWYLSQLIDSGDNVKSLTVRKIKQSDKEGNTSAVFKKTIMLKIEVERVEFHEYTDVLRVSGKVIEGAEDVAVGSYHTINVEPGTRLSIIKDRWPKFQLDRLDESARDKGSEILICAMDREAAYFAILMRQGHKVLAEISGEVEKKSDSSAAVKDFYGEIITLLKEYSERYKVKSIILASPAFWKEDLLKKIEDKTLRSKITLATCNAVGKTAIAEILKRQEIKNVLKDERNTHELKIVDRLLEELSKGALAAYGLAETRQAVEAGAAESLLITTSFISKRKQAGTFSELNSLMRLAESMSTEVTIVNSSHEGGKSLDGLGGVGATLRYRLS